MAGISNEANDKKQELAMLQERGETGSGKPDKGARLLSKREFGIGCLESELVLCLKVAKGWF